VYTLSPRVCDVRTFLGSFCWFFALLATFSLLFAHLIVVLSDKGWQLLLSCIDTTLLTYLLATLAQEQKRSEKEKKTCLVCIWRLQIIIRPIKTLVIYLFISVFILLAIFTSFFFSLPPSCSVSTCQKKTGQTTQSGPLSSYPDEERTRSLTLAQLFSSI
jgi:hypothetical protein